jgi:GntR family transcriptional regulator/MocR family aminotransferase
MTAPSLMELFLDTERRGGLAAQLYGQVREAIASGRVSAGDRLPPSRVLASDLGVSRFTVAEVYSRLAAEGYVTGRAGGGTIVTSMLAGEPVDGEVAALRPTDRASRIRRFDRNPRQRAQLDLRPGTVDLSLFPTAAWRRAMIRALGRAEHYGDPAGSVELREALAHWISRSRGVAATADRVVVTSGAQHAVDLVARVLLDPGDTVAVEEPGYPPVVELLRSLGADVVGVPVDDDGLVVDAVPAGTRLIYVTPSHQYPLGVVMSPARRMALLRWANANHAAVVEDDYDSQFRHGTRPLEPLQRLDREGRVIYVATFSKVLAPAMRIGFAVVPASILGPLVTLRQCIDWCPPAATEYALTALINDGHLDRHVRRAARVYRERQRQLTTALTDGLSIPSRVLPALTGLHVPLLLDECVDETAIAGVAARHDLMLGSLQRTYHFGPPVPGLVLGFGAVPTSRIGGAVAALDATLLELRRAPT